LAAGKSVYCEKPLATTLEDCDAIAAAAKSSGSLFYLGMNLRHGPVHELVHKMVEDGEIGRPLQIEANEWYYGGRTYFRRWNRLERFGGGLWLTKATHDFDLLNWISGGSPLRVHAASSLSLYKPKEGAAIRCRDCKLSSSCPDFFDASQADDLTKASEASGGLPVDLCLYNSDKDTFDNGMALVEYSNDVRASYALSVVASRSTRQMNVTGVDGLIEADMERCSVSLTKRHSGKRSSFDLSSLCQSSHGGADSRILDDFFDCHRKGRKPRSSWPEGRASVLVGLAAMRACETHSAVDLQALERELSSKRP